MPAPDSRSLDEDISGKNPKNGRWTAREEPDMVPGGGFEPPTP